MPCSWPTVYPRELATGKNASKRKIILAPLKRLRVATVSCFTKNAQLFLKKTLKSLPSFVRYRTNSKQWLPFLMSTHRFRHFVCFCLFSHGCVTNWTNKMKSAKSQTFSHRLMSTRKSEQPSPPVWKSFFSNFFQIPKTKFHFSLRLCRSKKYWWWS